MAGTFYAGTRVLERQIEECFVHRFGPGELPRIDKKYTRKIVGLVCHVQATCFQDQLPLIPIAILLLAVRYCLRQ